MFDTEKTRKKREKDGLVANVASMAEAGMYQEILRQEGIPSMVKAHGAGGIMQIYMGYSASGLGIYTEPERRQEAAALLEAFMKAPSETEKED